MAEETKSDRVTVEKLMVSTLAVTDALAKLLFPRGIITGAKFKARAGRIISRNPRSAKDSNL